MVGIRVGIQDDDENEFVENMEVWAEDSVIYAAGTRMPPGISQITRTSSQGRWPLGIEFGDETGVFALGQTDWISLLGCGPQRFCCPSSM